MNNPDAIIEELKKALDEEHGLADVLEQSLVKARDLAEVELNSDLFAALEWPTDIGQYEDYLKRFIRWTPHESDLKAWQNDNRQAQEVSDRMSHFYFLVDQKTGDRAPQDSDVFRRWMTEFARRGVITSTLLHHSAPKCCSRSSTTRRSIASTNR